MDFDWDNPYRTVRLPLFARQVVATSQPLAAQAGLSMLLQGGSAADAVVAAAAALTVVEPVSCGLGSDAFALVWDGERLHGLNASGPAPAAWSVDYFERKYGAGVPRPRRGWDTVTVPGAIAGWADLHARFGRLSFEQTLQPAIELAEAGYGVTPVVARKWAAMTQELQAQPGFAEAFLPFGRAPQIGEWFRFPAAAKALRQIAAQGPRDFYEGALAERIVAAARAGGAALTMEDLRQFRPEWVTPLSQRYRDVELHELPPNGQGIAALMALGLLERFDLAALPCDSTASQHLQIEAMKLAFADLYAHVGDPASMRVQPQQMLDPAYLDERARQIDRTRPGSFRPGHPPTGGTVYLTAADAQGMMISFIQSNYMGFGSGVVVPGIGVSLQNRGLGFSMDRASPNVVAGGRRPFHTIIPAFLTRQGQPLMSFGVMGGDMQPQGHVQSVVRMVDYRQQPQAACDAPRWKVNGDGSIDLEAVMDAKVQAELAAMGHGVASIADSYMDFGAGQYIWRAPSGHYVAASDARRDGQAVGF